MYKFIKVIPSKWIEQPQHQTPQLRSLVGLSQNDHMKNETLRLEAKYHRALSRKEVAHELGISIKTLERRMEQVADIPQYKELRTGRVLFPISCVATYLSQGLIQTV